MSTKIIKNAKAFKAHCEKTMKLGDQFRKALDVGLRSAIYHVVMHEDVRPLNELIEATAPNVVKNAHKLWVDTFAKEVVTYSTKEKAFVPKPHEVLNTIRNDEAIMANLEERLETCKPYYELTKEAPFQGFTLIQLLKSTVKRAETAIEKHNNGEISDEDFEKIDTTGLDEAKAFIASLERSQALGTTSTNETTVH